MIKIVKPEAPPAFVGNGTSVKATLKLKAKAEAILQKGDGNLTSLKFGQVHWSKAKQPLKVAQKSKCCYCEDFFGSGDPQVEHFRPIGASKQAKGSEQLRPGYWWLAYEWENLLVSCATCNVFKSTIFPIENEMARARMPTDDSRIEGNILLNPAVDSPDEHIVFIRELAKPESLRGEITIETIQLNREGLKLDRLRTLVFVEREIQLLAEANTDVEWLVACRKLMDLCGASADYSAMSRAFLIERLPEFEAIL